MELRHLRYFQAVAEELHFGHAAERLHISQPPLSLQIQALERELGVKLLERTRRSVSLTRYGKVFLKRARAILNEVERAVDEMRVMSSGDQDALTVGYKSSVMLEEIAPLIIKFRNIFPKVRIKFIQASVEDQYDAVREHSLDIGFVDAQIDDQPANLVNENLGGLPVVIESLMMAVPANHPLAGRKRVSLRDFSQDSFIVMDRQTTPTVYDLVISLCHKAGFSPIIKYHADQLPVALTYVAAGYGVSLAPPRVANSWQGMVTLIPLRENAIVSISAIFRHDQESIAANAMLKLLSDGKNKGMNKTRG